MGAKTNITQASTLTPEQAALLKQYLYGTTAMMEGMELGTPYRGAGYSEYNPRTFQMGGAPQPASKFPWAEDFMNRFRQRLGGQTGSPLSAALAVPTSQATIPSSPAPSQTAPMYDTPLGLNSMVLRNLYTSPVVNPFRRNIGG